MVDQTLAYVFIYRDPKVLASIGDDASLVTLLSRLQYRAAYGSDPPATSEPAPKPDKPRRTR